MTTTLAPAPSAAAGTGDDFSGQQQLALDYHAALTAVDKDPTRVSPAGREALDKLLTSVERLIRKQAVAYLSGGGRDPSGDEIEEAVSEARLGVIEALQSYEPAKNRSFRSFAFDENTGAVAKALERVRHAGAIDRGMNDKDVLALRYAQRALHDLLRSGYSPSLDDVICLAYQRCMDWSVGVDGDLPDPDDPQLIPRVAARVVRGHGRLRKEGTLAALERIKHLTVPGVIPAALDTLEVDPHDLGAAELAPHQDVEDMGPVGRVAMVGLSRAERDILSGHLSGDSSDPTNTKYHSRSSAESRRVNAALAAARASAAARLRAPHAHFAVLAPTLDLQFDDAAPGRPAWDPQQVLLALDGTL